MLRWAASSGAATSASRRPGCTTPRSAPPRAARPSSFRTLGGRPSSRGGVATVWLPSEGPEYCGGARIRHTTKIGGALNALKFQCAQRDSLSELLL